jgi:RimJ/RimL family protein N-acetyltransferase
MARVTRATVRIEPWGEEDLGLLHGLLGDPVMMEHLGGPDTVEQIEARHARYLTTDDVVMRVVDEATGAGVGWVGYWEREWQGTQVFETGWSVLPPHWGRGIARSATALLLVRAADERRLRWIHAFPGVDNAASNGVCRSLGFELRGPVDFPLAVKEHTLRCHDWRLDLEAVAPRER